MTTIAGRELKEKRPCGHCETKTSTTAPLLSAAAPPKLCLKSTLNDSFVISRQRVSKDQGYFLQSKHHYVLTLSVHMQQKLSNYSLQ